MNPEGSFRQQVRRGVARRMRRVWRIVSLVFFLFIFPVSVLYFGLIPFSFRLWVLGVYTVIVAILALLGQRSLHSLGIRSDNFSRAIIPYVVFTLLGLCALFFYAQLLGKTPVFGWARNPHLLFLFIPVSFTQEFLYRGFLMPELRRFYVSIVSVIVVDALLFTFLHIVYGEPLITLPLALIGGLGFSYMYYKYPNLWLIALSHSALNFMVVLYSFF